MRLVDLSKTISEVWRRDPSAGPKAGGWEKLRVMVVGDRAEIVQPPVAAQRDL